eukprot:6765900-Prymnesium_polylepis.1
MRTARDLSRLLSAYIWPSSACFTSATRPKPPVPSRPTSCRSSSFRGRRSDSFRHNRLLASRLSRNARGSSVELNAARSRRRHTVSVAAVTVACRRGRAWSDSSASSPKKSPKPSDSSMRTSSPSRSE